MKHYRKQTSIIYYILIGILLYCVPYVVDAGEIDDKYLPYLLTESDVSGYELKSQGDDFWDVSVTETKEGVRQTFDKFALSLFMFDSFQEAVSGLAYWTGSLSVTMPWGSHDGSVIADESWHGVTGVDPLIVFFVKHNIAVLFATRFVTEDERTTYTTVLTKILQKIESNVDPAVLADMEQARKSQLSKEKFNQMADTVVNSELISGYELFTDRDSKWVIDENGYAMGRRTEWKKENGELIGIDICDFESEEAAQSAVEFKTTPMVIRGPAGTTRQSPVRIPYYNMDDSQTFAQELENWKELFPTWSKALIVPCAWRKGNIAVQVYYYSPEEIDINIIQSIGYNLADRISF